MKNIQIKFEICKDLDKMMCFKFLNVEAGGIDFSDGIIQIHPEMESIQKIKNDKEKKERISEYFDHFYEEYKSMIDKDLLAVEKKGNKIQDKFFLEVQKIFGNYEWPKGKYIGYISTMNCNTVFGEDRTGQIFAFLPDRYNGLIVHEMLHFIFLDYFNKNVKSKKLIDNQGMILEVFNAVIMNEPAFRKMIVPDIELGYPDHKEIIKKMTREWKKTKDIKKGLTKF